MRKSLVTFLCFLQRAWFHPHPFQWGQNLGCNNITKLVVVGDSLSDNGINDQEFYGFRRYSSGNVWNEYLAQQFNLKLENYAHGGSKSDYGNYDFDGWSGNLWQVEQILSTGPISSDTLIAYQAGGLNDIWQNATAADADAIARNNIVGVGKLIEGGARNIFLLNVADPAIVPLLRNGDNDTLQLFVEKVAEINRLLKTYASETLRLWSKVKDLTKLNFHIIDFCELFGQFPELFKLEGFVKGQGSKFGDQNEYGFIFDQVHPSDSAHQYIASKIGDQLKDLYFDGKTDETCRQASVLEEQLLEAVEGDSD